MMPESRGIVFIEARIRDDVPHEAQVGHFSHDKVNQFQIITDILGLNSYPDKTKLKHELEHQLSSENLTFELLEDILEDARTTDGEHKLGSLYHIMKNALQSLKVVEYIGPDTDLACFTTDNVKVEVQIYSIYNTPRGYSENQKFPQAEIIPLPHSNFANQWEELIFQDDVKSDLICMMTNILRFSKLGKHGEINPLIFLYGPPGTGKTQLCQGLAQKISIRHNAIFPRSRLIQVKTATLLSKYYSESARQVDEVFSKIDGMCSENPKEFICVLIDEVESIASSREFSIKNGESQDSLRATNALLTGIDRMKANLNIIFMFTSNMHEALDSAFLDRCGIKRFIGPPCMISQYEILRRQIQKLTMRGIIKVAQPTEIIPCYDEALLASHAGHKCHPGTKLLNIVQLIQSGNSRFKSGKEISGRSLTQLPEQAIVKYLRSSTCDLNMEFSFITKLIQFEQNQEKLYMQNSSPSSEVIYEKKRKLTLIFEDDSNSDSELAKKLKAIIHSHFTSSNYKLRVEEYEV